MESKNEDTNQVPRFKKGTIEEIFKLAWAEERKVTQEVRKMIEKPPKLNEISLHLSAEYLRLFTIELIHRANQVAQQQQEEEEENEKNKSNLSQNSQLDHKLSGLIQVHHLRKAAPGVLLDF